MGMEMLKVKASLREIGASTPFSFSKKNHTVPHTHMPQPSATGQYHVSDHHIRIAQELQIRPQQAEAVIRLLGEDATVPFIARYRKEATGSLDEVAVSAIRDRLASLKELEKRREAVLTSLAERELLTPELQHAVDTAENLTALEDIYLPYRP